MKPTKVITHREPSALSTCPHCSVPTKWALRWIGRSVLLEGCPHCTWLDWQPIDGEDDSTDTVVGL